MAKVAGSFREDFGEKLEVEAAMVEGKVEGLLVGAGRGEVMGAGAVFEVSKILLGVVPRDIMGESGGEAFRVDRGVD
ncbi:hypothetical protein Tco_1362318 [Tanacetum coccineum]